MKKELETDIGNTTEQLNGSNHSSMNNSMHSRIRESISRAWMDTIVLLGSLLKKARLNESDLPCEISNILRVQYRETSLVKDIQNLMRFFESIDPSICEELRQKLWMVLSHSKEGVDTLMDIELRGLQRFSCGRRVAKCVKQEQWDKIPEIIQSSILSVQEARTLFHFANLYHKRIPNEKALKAMRSRYGRLSDARRTYDFSLA